MTISKVKIILRLFNLTRSKYYLKAIRFFYAALNGRESKEHSALWYIGRLNDPAILNKYIPENFKPKKCNSVEISAIENTKFSVDLDDHVQFRLFMDGYFDIVPILFAKILCNNKTFVDIGANIGAVCLPVANNNIFTIAIEASPTMLRKLYENAHLNMSNLIIVGAAVGEVDGKIINLYSPGGGNAGATSLLKDWNSNQRDTKIEKQFMYKLDTIIYNTNQKNIGLTKMDIEGYEYFGIMGALKTINDNKPAILMEWRPDILSRADIVVQNPIELFSEDYKFYSIKTTIEKSNKIFVKIFEFNSNHICENLLCLSILNKEHVALVNLIKSNNGISGAISLNRIDMRL